MRRHIATWIALAVLSLAGVAWAATYGGWTMTVHEGQTTTDFPVANVDSMTFDFRLVPQLVTVPAGTFTMGDGHAECGDDEREVTLTQDFLLGQHAVTNQEYLEALQWAYDRGYVYVPSSIPCVYDNLDGSFLLVLLSTVSTGEIAFDASTEQFYLQQSTTSYAQTAYPDGYNPALHPVINVSWYGAARYCDWLSMWSGLDRAYEHTGDWSCNGGEPYSASGYRLPTDAEWEYAAQFNDERIYPWGDDSPDCQRANCKEGYGEPFCVGWTTPANTYPAAPESLGLSDMAGNVGEWCNDWALCDLGTDSVTNPAGPDTGSKRVIHNANWSGFDQHLRCARRGQAVPGSPVWGGFRIARTVEP